MRRQLVLAACGAVLLGCSPPPAEEGCTAMGGQSGVSLTVLLTAAGASPSALGRQSAGLVPVRAEVCVERQPCRQVTARLIVDRPTPTAAHRQLTGTLPIASLKKGQEVTVVLLPAARGGSAAGSKHASTRKSATARPFQPNGARCDGDLWAVASLTFRDTDLL